MRPVGFPLMGITSRILHQVIIIPGKNEGELAHVRDFLKNDDKQSDINLKKNDS